MYEELVKDLRYCVSTEALCGVCKHSNEVACEVRLLERAADAIEELTAADVAPVRHGRWENRWICSNMTGYEYACSCSECGKPTYRISTLEPMPPYCPNCGAKMEEKE